jgi:hypothetical protein
MSKKYSFPDYDKNLALKLSVEMWLIIVYFLRPLVLKVLTIKMGRGATSGNTSWLKEIIYPDDFGFFIAILAALPVIPVMIAYNKRKPGASDAIKTLWRNGTNFLSVAAILNIIVIFIPLVVKPFYHITMLSWIQLAVAVGVLIFLRTSQRVKDTFADFPEDSDKKDQKY